jgi:choline dehydrogenase-like flavoprotein
VRPASSTDPLAAPLADAAFLRNPLDVAILIEAIKFARTVAHTPELAEFNPVELVPGAAVASDTELETYIRGAAESLFHPSGTCAVGKLEDGGVVDTEFRVHGVRGLRVVDASVFPVLPAAHIQSSVYAVAEMVSWFYSLYSVFDFRGSFFANLVFLRLRRQLSLHEVTCQIGINSIYLIYSF